MRTLFALLLACAAAQPARIPLVYWTDLFHPYRDPDDHLDLATVSRDIAAAFNREPALFRSRVKAIYANIGNAAPGGEIDPIAALGMNLRPWRALVWPRPKETGYACRFAPHLSRPARACSSARAAGTNRL
jgi:hypothetical protein